MKESFKLFVEQLAVALLLSGIPFAAPSLKNCMLGVCTKLQERLTVFCAIILIKKA